MIRLVALDDPCGDCIVGRAMLQLLVETAVREVCRRSSSCWSKIRAPSRRSPVLTPAPGLSKVVRMYGTIVTEMCKLGG